MNNNRSQNITNYTN